MEIHDLNSFSGTPGATDYLATDNGTDTTKISATGLMAPLNARIDNIIAGGDAPSAAEVTDARLGASVLGSIQYTSLGSAIRGQVEDLYYLDVDIRDMYAGLAESVFKAPITFSRLTSATYWTFGQEINLSNGANYTNSSACRTAYISFSEPLVLSLDNSDYNFIVWVYSAESVSSAVYTPSIKYENRSLLILPTSGTSYFRVGVRRVDGATMTTNYSDHSSDAYKILNAIHTYKVTSDNLDTDDAPVNAKAVKDNALVFKGYLATQTDLNALIIPGVYVLTTDRSYLNAPVNTGFLYVVKVGGVLMQLIYSLGTSDATFIPAMYVRFASGGATSVTATWQMISRGRKTPIRMACFGDSIMYGQNGNTSSQVEEQYRIPSILAYDLNIRTENYGVGSQGYIGLISEKAYDNIASKDLTQFNAMIICYGVNDGYADLGTWDSTDESTIMGQFNKIINYVFSQNRSIRLIVVAPYNGKNVGTFPKYWYGERSHPQGYVSRQVLSDTLKQACEYYNIPYIEQTSSPINGFTIDTLIGSDGVHPSLEGYLQLGAWLSGEVGKLIG